MILRACKLRACNLSAYENSPSDVEQGQTGRIDPESEAIGGVGLLVAKWHRPAYIRRAWQTAAIMIPYIVVIRTIVRWTTQRF
jgi:hypothetical protein